MWIAHGGTLGVQGRFKTRRMARMKSELVTGQGPVALKVPTTSRRSIAHRNISFRSWMCSQLIYWRPVPAAPPRKYLDSLDKVATNTPLYNWMEEDMDINAGTILEGTETIGQVGQRIFEKIIAVAGGEKTKSELAGMGDEEFAPWLLGPTF